MVQREPGLGVLTAHRLAVWGDPIAHSRSPQMHRAAYDALGLAWEYDRCRVDDAGFAAAVASLDATWRGLSLTMPLKQVAFAAADRVDRGARLTGAVNTYLLEASGPVGFNTDIGGIVAALAEIGCGGVDHARIIGAGATATSALVAPSDAGVERVEVLARRPQSVAPMVELGDRVGVRVRPAEPE